jgi:hypothetical protein
MDRRELVRKLVLNTICDGFENLDQIILPMVAKDCGDLGIAAPERPEVETSLASLVEEGLAKAYDLRNLRDGRDPFSGELPGMPSLDFIEEDFRTYFYITQKGMDLHLSDNPEWPFDDEGEPVPNWHLDEHHKSG